MLCQRTYRQRTPANRPTAQPRSTNACVCVCEWSVLCCAALDKVMDTLTATGPIFFTLHPTPARLCGTIPMPFHHTTHKHQAVTPQTHEGELTSAHSHSRVPGSLHLSANAIPVFGSFLAATAVIATQSTPSTTDDFVHNHTATHRHGFARWRRRKHTNYRSVCTRSCDRMGPNRDTHRYR